MPSFIIAVDIGNTSVSMALAQIGRCLRLSHKRYIPTHGITRKAVSRVLAQLAHDRKLEGSIICSVVPAINALWSKALYSATGHWPMILDHGLSELGVDIAIPKPYTVGADRIANASAVSHWHGTPSIVVDFGTALTFDVVSKDNKYIGGVIAPGLPLMTDYFSERTARLPTLKWTKHGAHIFPALRYQRPHAIGNNTKEAMIIGAETGYLGMVREILKQLRRALNNRRIHLCATGGYAKWILSKSDIKILIDPDLTLRGISRIYTLNR